MGADIHSFAERKLNGKWQKVEEPLFAEDTEPFGWRSYNVFGFLANVRNYSNIKPIFETKGLPIDSEYLNSESKYDKYTSRKREIESDWDYHSHSYITLKELLEVDYDNTFRDVRGTDDQQFSYKSTLESILGEVVVIKDFLGTSFFSDLEVLKTLGNPDEVRIVFYFDN